MRLPAWQGLAMLCLYAAAALAAGCWALTRRARGPPVRDESGVAVRRIYQTLATGMCAGQERDA